MLFEDRLTEDGRPADRAVCFEDEYVVSKMLNHPQNHHK